MGTSIERIEFLDTVIEGINDRVKADHMYRVENCMDGELEYYIREGFDVKDAMQLIDDTEIHDRLNTLLSMKVDEKIIEKLLFECSSIESHGIYCPNNYIASWIHGEAEIQIDELNEVLEGTTEFELNYIQERIECYWNPKDHSCDLVYDDRNSDVTYVILDTQEFLKKSKKLMKGKN